MPELQSALTALNQTSVLEWAAQFPKLSVVALANQLSGRIPPILLQQAMVKEARERGTFPSLARALLVRLLLRDFPRGLGQGSLEDGRAALASAFSVWILIFDPDQRVAAEAIWSAVVAELEANPDWVPDHGDEPRLLELFSGYNLERSKRATMVTRAHERIEERIANQRTAQGRLDALLQLPPGHGFLHAASVLDADVRNGGFAHFYKNTGGVEVPLAIACLNLMQHTQLAAIVEESLLFARENHRHLVAPTVLHEPKFPGAAAPRDWSRLEKAYVSASPSLFESFATLIENRAHLFEPPFRMLQNHQDGRKWKVRTSGAGIELEIELADGTCIARRRSCSSALKAEQEVQTMINEQLLDGFVDVA